MFSNENQARLEAVESYKSRVREASRYGYLGLHRELGREIDLEIAPKYGVDPEVCWDAVWDFQESEFA